MMGEFDIINNDSSRLELKYIVLSLNVVKFFSNIYKENLYISLKMLMMQANHRKELYDFSIGL